MLKIETLRCFSTVAETGNLAEAAMRLGRTQSALSMTLKQLEAHLGARLFETERKNRLTALGEQVFRMAQQQLRQFDEAVQAMEAAARAPQGLLRLASIPSASGLALPQAIAQMAARHPALQMELRDMDTGLVVEAMAQGQADLGIASGRPSLNGIRQEALFEDAFGLICAAGHPLAAQARPPGLEQVLAAGFIRNPLCATLDAPALQTGLAGAQVMVHNTHSLIAMVRTGAWVSILPRSVARILPDALSFRRIADLEAQRTVSLLIREAAQFPALVADFAEILRSCDWGAGAPPSAEV